MWYDVLQDTLKQTTTSGREGEQWHTTTDKEKPEMPREQGPWGGLLLVVLLAFGIYAVKLSADTSLLWQGVAAQGVIVGEQSANCVEGSGNENTFSVQFTDHTGQVNTSPISQCDYSGFNASPGDSVTIVYLPDNPDTIAPPDGLLATVQGEQFMAILLGLSTLILLPLWIRERIRMAALQRQWKQAAAERWRAMAGPLANPNGTDQD